MAETRDKKSDDLTNTGGRPLIEGASGPVLPAKGNPNFSAISKNRGDQIKRDDKTSNHYLGLYDIDECVQYYFDNIIKPTVNDGDDSV